jgi:diguanylate cyclase (GGDEF)-like protein
MSAPARAAADEAPGRPVPAAPGAWIASAGSPVFTAIGRSDGLPDSSVPCAAQDSRGFIWLGTRRGLVRYDGHAFKLFSRAPFAPDSLVEDSVRALYAEGDAIWAGTSGGLARLDLATERFAAYTKRGGDEGSLSSDVVTAIARDGRGALWVGTVAGLNRLDESTGRFRRFLHDPADPSSLPSDRVGALKVDREGRLWIGGVGMGLARFDYGRGGFISYRERPGRYAPRAGGFPDDVTAIDQDPSGRLWLGRASGGVALFDPSSGRFEALGVCDDEVRSICAAEEGVVYLGTRSGLVEYRPASGTVARHRAAGAAGSLAGDRVRALLRDRAGDLWIGTDDGGLCMLDRARRGRESIAASEGGMPEGRVFAALVDRRGRLWVGTREGGIARRDSGTSPWRRLGRGLAIPSSRPEHLTDFLREDGSGAIWTGLYGGLSRYDEELGDFIEVRIPGSPSEAIGAMADDPSSDASGAAGGLWLGTLYSGLVHWDRASGALRRFHRESGRDDPHSDDVVTALGWDSRDRLWVGTNRGLDRIEGKLDDGSARVVRYRYDPAAPGGISSDSIRAIFSDSRGTLWVGTGGGGLMRYEPETDSFTSFTSRDGLPGNVVLSALEDARGNLWIATQSGLALYDRSAGRFRKVSLGSSGGEELFTGSCAAPDGSLLFGSYDRLLRIDPAVFEFDDLRPPLALVSAETGRSPSLGPAALDRLEHLDLPLGEGSVSFEFAALDFRDPGQLLYSYRLQGFDAAWSPPGRANRAVYTNLPRGDYVFRVKAANGDGLWNEDGLSLKLRVRRRIWTSPLALALYALLLIGGGYAISRAAMGAALSSLGAENESLRAKLVSASAAIESAAIVDSLTGLPNRRKIMEHLELAISRASQSKLDIAVLMVDIDHFKSYNDRSGKAAGNECLREVARAISSCVRRSSDVVARYGGEEFVVVMERTSIVGALSEAEAIRKAVEALGAVTVSVGCVSAESGAETSPEALIAAAERAMMAAKMLGRNRTSV